MRSTRLRCARMLALAAFVASVCASACKTRPAPAKSSTPTPASTSAPEVVVRCPAPEPSLLEGAEAPPWERDPLGRWPKCLETRDGARVTVEKDTRDLDG